MVHWVPEKQGLAAAGNRCRVVGGSPIIAAMLNGSAPWIRGKSDRPAEEDTSQCVGAIL